MRLYQFDPATGAYRGQFDAEPDPLEWRNAQEAARAPILEAAAAAIEAAGQTARQDLAACLAAADHPDVDPDVRAGEIAAARAAFDAVSAAGLQARADAIAAAEAAAAAVEPPVWLIPDFCTSTRPCRRRAGHGRFWTGEDWIYVADQVEEEVTPPEPDAAVLAARARGERDALIARFYWRIERHRDEAALGRTTTRTGEEHLADLSYVQDLRDIALQPGFPASIDWPVQPD